MSLFFGSPTYGVVVDLESFDDFTAITTEIPGLSCSSATILTSGISLNAFAFPPHSGGKVIFDDGGAIEILFTPLSPGLGDL